MELSVGQFKGLSELLIRLSVRPLMGSSELLWGHFLGLLVGILMGLSELLWGYFLGSLVGILMGY